MKNKYIDTQEFNHSYDYEFSPTKEYLKSMPDLQNGDTIKGSKVGIERVGISNFRLPLKIQMKDGGVMEVEASVIGTVSLEGVNKGINMSRIIRTFYEYKDETFSLDTLEKVLLGYRERLGSYGAHIQIHFNYRLWQESMRSVDTEGNKNGGW